MWFDCAMKRVLIVEDEPMLRTMLEGFLASQGYEVRGAGDAAEANRIAALFQPEVAVLDIHLGSGPSGLDLAIALSHLFPRISIIFLTNVADPRILGHRASQLPKGYAYVIKAKVKSAEDLAAVVEATLIGKVHNGLRDNLESRSEFSDLSDAQISVLRLVASGASNKQIAHERGTTERAVESLIQRAASALDLKPSGESNLRVQVANAYLRALGIATHA